MFTDWNTMLPHQMGESVSHSEEKDEAQVKKTKKQKKRNALQKGTRGWAAAALQFKIIILKEADLTPFLELNVKRKYYKGAKTQEPCMWMHPSHGQRSLYFMIRKVSDDTRPPRCLSCDTFVFCDASLSRKYVLGNKAFMSDRKTLLLWLVWITCELDPSIRSSA